MIVWVHGFPLSSAVFSKQPPGFAPDLAGFGSAPAPDTQYSMDDYARDVLAAMDAQGIERAVLAGLSMGGYVCFAMARLAPERIRGVILIDTRETPDTDEQKKGRQDTIIQVREQGTTVVVESMLPKMLTPSAPPELVNDVRRIMLTSSPLGVITALKAMAERPDSSDVLTKLDVPALVVAGDQDPITPPSEAKRMAGKLKNASAVTIQGAAHLSNFEQPDAFNEAVESFLKRHGL